MANRSHAKKHNTLRNKLRVSRRQLLHQQLERRELMAADAAPSLISVSPNDGQIFDFASINEVTRSPSELTFRFGGDQQIDPDTLQGIRITAAGGDGFFGNGNDRIVTPGYLGFGETERIVIARFAEALPDDQYKIEIFGFDQAASGIVGLRNIEGDLFQPSNAGADREELYFDVELGALVTAVVPQPIETINGVRRQQRAQIHVFFNNDPLSAPGAGPVTTGSSSASVVNPQFYKLYFTADTVENTDDEVLLPTSITYDPALNRAVLTFNTDLSEWAPVAAADGAGTLRLRIGSNEGRLAAPESLVLPADETGANAPGDTFGSATSLGTLFDGAGKSVVIESEIAPTQEYLLQWPGAPDEPGVREIRRNSQLFGRADTELGITTLYYNFKRDYGDDTQGNRLDNAITPAQRQRTREILSLYEEHLGVRFVETENLGLQIVTGDMRAVEVTADTGQGTGLSIFRSDDSDPGIGLLILDAGENWYDGYGQSPDGRPSWFLEALRGIGSLLGIGDMFDRPPGTAAGSESDLDFGLPTEPDFLSQSDITVGQHLFRAEGRDIDLYRFSVNEAGRLTAETFAERMNGSSLLDTSLTLWRRVDGGGPNDFELVARNDDFYSNDSFVGIDLTAGEYVVGVSASGNDTYNPAIADSGLGGRSEGKYQLRLVFRSAATAAITDTSGSALDGDADGVAGGDYNFWFRTARAVDPTAPSSQPKVIFVDKMGSDASGNGAIASPLQTIDEAVRRSRPGDIIRVLPNAGNDGRFDTLSDNRAYEIGRGGVNNQELSDGLNLEIPRGVTVMVDAGVILKLRNAGISVGSNTVDTDRSESALQVLGTPILVGGNGTAVRGPGGAAVSGRVVFTSYDDQQVGVDTNPLQTTPTAGQWGGLSFRNDVDYAQGRPVHENEGIFLNYVAQADIRYGGGTAGGQVPVTPIEMHEARPTVHYSIIRNSADAALSADPNSFEETNFHAPVYQRGDSFTSDYDRVGPDLAGIQFVNNSINGLFVRIDTPAVGQLEPMTVSGRFDDTDITHVISQVLVVQGTPGGPILQTERPNVFGVTVNPTTGSSTLSGTYNYVLTFVDVDGNESLASELTRSTTVNGQAIRLSGLPAAPEGFVGRRLYRLNPTSGEYEFVDQLNRSQGTFTDTGATRGGTIDRTIAESFRPRYDARLSVDPGMVVKMQGSRIETTFGADFYAEGVDGREVIFTSRQDDRYGAGGTFDTNNDRVLDANGNVISSGDAAAPGDWGGLVFRQGSDASVDFAVIEFGGGETSTDGNFASFNAMEVLQARARITNTTFANNASGEDDSLTRGGYGFNDSATLFIRGSQPIIVDNVFRDNAGAALSINPDALNFSNVTDRGRATGELDRFSGYADNQGPLVRQNRLENNAINGMVVRGEVLTTESVWDDADIVHVVGGDVVTVDHHYNGGLRLESSPLQSLVVKFTAGARLLATGRPLDIDDRIGGSLQVVGQPGFPVVLTSIHDDSVGAGFTFDGQSQTDTNNSPTEPQPGDWHGIVLDSFANDRNVQIVLENEPPVSTSAGQNAIPGTAQRIGSLAAGEKLGDENKRLGFEIQGTLTNPGDVDVYSFLGQAGSEVWIDLDRTTYGLDSVVELIDENGNILVLSDKSFSEAGNPNQIYRDPSLEDHAVNSLRKSGIGQSESPNPEDGGFRVLLPGATGASNVYYVRVRSSNLAPDGSGDLTDRGKVRDGLSHGAYRLGIRLREVDEVAGSTVQFADIRYAVNGIDLVSAPLHSPLAGEAAERLFNETDPLGNPILVDRNGGSMTANPATADPLGNLLSTDRASLTVTGEIGNQSFTVNPTAMPDVDIDLFRLDLFYDSLETEIFRPDNRFVPLTFDIDYADGLGRVNTSISIYDSAGRLILSGRDSNVAGDVGTPLRGVDMTNLSAGSAGVLDAHIGPVELPEGVYYVAVHSDLLMPAPLGQAVNGTTPYDLVRRMPINSLRPIVSDDLDGRNFTADQPIQPAFTNESVVPYSLEDVTMFVALQQGINGGTERTTIATFDPFTGMFERTLGETGPQVSDLAIRGDGELYSYSTAPQTGPSNNGNVGNYLNISTINGNDTNVGDDGLTFRRNNAAGDGTEADDNAQLIVHAMAYNPNDTSVDGNDRVYVVGNRDNAGRSGEVVWTRNIMYSNVATSGATTNRGSTTADDRDFGQGPYREPFGPASQKFELGIVDTGGLPDVDDDGNAILSPGEGGNITGMAVDPDNTRYIYAVDDRGGVYRVDLFAPRRTVDFSALSPGSYSSVLETEYLGTIAVNANHPAGFPEFSGMTLGPRTTENGAYRQTMFATTIDGWMYAIGLDDSGPDLAAVPAPIFSGGASAVPMMYSDGTPLSVRPVGVAFSTLEENPWHETIDRRTDPGHGNYMPYDQSRFPTGLGGGTSLYFGFEPTNNQADNRLEHPENDSRGTLAPGGSHGSVVTAPFSLAGYSSADKPTVYFDYFLETDGTNYNPGVNLMRDSFRVFAAGDDGQWQLLATNNSFKEFERGDEFDYFAQTGIPVQELHDNSDSWRQARVDISPLAGNQEIRLRFDFSTAGGIGFGGNAFLSYRDEIKSVAADRLRDGQTLEIAKQVFDPVFGGTTFEFTTFEVDLGYVLDFPSGGEINPGDSFTVVYPLSEGSPDTLTQTVTFTNLPAGPGEVRVTPGMTSSQVAAAVLAALDVGIDARRFGQSSVGLTNAVDVDNNAFGSGVFFSSTPGVGLDSVPIEVEGDLTAEEVITRLQEAFVIGLGEVDENDEPVATTANFKTFADRVVLHNHTVLDAGPFGLSSYLPGDEFGDFQSNRLNNANPRPGQANEVEGVYLDNLIIGFAERGEVVINAPASDFDFVRNPESDYNAEQPENSNEIFTGGYSLEIRRSAEYGVPDDYDPINLILNEEASLGRSFDTNDRLDGAVTLVAQPGGEIRDGDTFTLTDGTRALTFEFDSITAPGVEPGNVRVSFDPRTSSASDVAAAIRNAINGSQVQSILNIRAATGDSRELGGTTSHLVNLFGEYVFVNPSSGRNLKVDLVKQENFNDRVAAQTFPQISEPDAPVEYVLEPDTLARAYPTQYVDGATDTLVAVGKIGDRATTGRGGEIDGDLPWADMDILKLHLFAGNEIDIDLDAVTTAKGSNRLTTPMLAVFDADGIVLATSRDLGSSATAPGESIEEAFLRFAAPADGHYYIMVLSQPDSPFELPGFGEYQLTVRPASNRNDVLYVDYHMDEGDLNRFRDQGQIVISSNFISNSQNWGISATAGDRDVTDVAPLAGTALPKPGAARLLRNENTARLLPGAVITNNVVVAGGSGGILFEGDASPNGSMPGGVPFGRIVNNTVVGVPLADPDPNDPNAPAPTPQGVGIRVGANASPTVLNNIISGFDIGVDIDGSAASQSTVVGGNIYKDNTTASNFPLGSLSFNLDTLPASQAALFTDPANGIYIPAPGSLAIDSSFASLSDRQEFFNTVKQPSGIAPSPIVSPSFDAYGQPRIDDPLVETPAGVGANVFIDRGALDRADLAGPTSSLTVPDDFVEGQGVQTVGGDVNGDVSYVWLPTGTLEFFEIQLLEPTGSGLNDMTVTSEAVVLTENGRRLEPGVDYIFGYSETSNTIRLTPLTGIWRSNAAYEVTLNNRDRFVLQAPVGNEVVDGEQIIVTDENGVRAFLEYETGYVLHVPRTLTLTVPFGVGGEEGFRDGDQFTITSPSGISETFELNVSGDVSDGVVEIPLSAGASATDVRNAILGALIGRSGTLEIAPVALENNEIQLGSLEGHTVDPLSSPLLVDGVDRGVTDGDTVTYFDGTNVITFEFNLLGDLDTDDESDVLIPFRRTDTHIQLAEKLATAIRNSGLDLANPQALGDGSVHLGGSVGDLLDTSNSAILPTGLPGVTDSLVLSVAATGAAGFAEGDQFAIVHNGVTTLFELGFDRDVEIGAEPIRLTVGEGPEAVAAKIANAIRNADIGLDPTVGEDGEIRLNEPFGYELDLLDFATDPTTAALTLSGVPGGAVAVPIVPSPTLSSEAVAEAVSTALESTPLVSPVFTPGDGSLWFANAQLVEGSGVTQVGAIRDRAGNALQPNRANNETQYTIFLGSGFDYGDAPEPLYDSSRVNDGPRHAISDNLRLGSSITPDADAIPNDGDVDDGISLLETVYTGFSASFTVEIQADSNNFVLDYWVDWNGDGIFAENERGERLVGGVDLSAGLNPIAVDVPPLDVPEFPGEAFSKAGETFARFRLSSNGVDGPGGTAMDGEVEDFAFTIQVNPFQNGANRFDVNASGDVSPLDALQVINAINRGGSNPPPLDPYNPGTRPPYLDVNGDGVVGPLDALQVINYIENAIRGGEGEGGEGEGDLLDELAVAQTGTRNSSELDAVDAFFGEFGS
ncbi:dockerin type I domain-containing protein [Candidatus Laterigemmans baculatus]|uniref:dockerin type I domain-containing protein n=1 Tax=Candidatus Laterigemmans baculatus TaxID=2770505 RepID=UPI0013DC83AB|nr:dockerin type I domain-containing protein [Candidatus Laterigemmans baculatus]